MKMKHARTWPAIALIAVCGGAVLSACADRVRWTNPDMPESQWSGDRTACRKLADDQAARQLDSDRAARANSGTGGGLVDDFAVADAKKLRQELYESCLRGRGYRKQKVEG